VTRQDGFNTTTRPWEGSRDPHHRLPVLRYRWPPRGRRRPKEITDMPATGFSIVDGYLEGEGK